MCTANPDQSPDTQRLPCACEKNVFRYDVPALQSWLSSSTVTQTRTECCSFPSPRTGMLIATASKASGTVEPPNSPRNVEHKAEMCTC